jgi:hypothetical protein
MSNTFVVLCPKPIFPVVLTRSARLSHFMVSCEFSMLIPALRAVNASEKSRSSGVASGLKRWFTAEVRPTHRENVSTVLNTIPTTRWVWTIRFIRVQLRS